VYFLRNRKRVGEKGSQRRNAGPSQTELAGHHKDLLFLTSA
jgi:hypothetical protein